MAREYKVETMRSGEDAELYFHNDDTIEFTVPETNVPAEYLELRLRVLRELLILGREYGLTYFEMNVVS